MPADNRFEIKPWELPNFFYFGFADSDTKPVDELQEKSQQDAEQSA